MLALIRIRAQSSDAVSRRDSQQPALHRQHLGGRGCGVAHGALIVSLAGGMAANPATAGFDSRGTSRIGQHVRLARHQPLQRSRVCDRDACPWPPSGPGYRASPSFARRSRSLVSGSPCRYSAGSIRTSSQPTPSCAICMRLRPVGFRVRTTSLTVRADAQRVSWRQFCASARLRLRFLEASSDVAGAADGRRHTRHCAAPCSVRLLQKSQQRSAIGTANRSAVAAVPERRAQVSFSRNQRRIDPGPTPCTRLNALRNAASVS